MSQTSPMVTSVLLEPNYTQGVYDKFYIVLHSIECPPGPEWAESLGGPNYLQNPSEQHSVHYIVDADSIVQGRWESDWAWGCGSPGSKRGIHIEQAGYAAFSKDQWLGNDASVGTSYTRPNGQSVTFTQQDAKDMAAQFNLMARFFADIITRHGWKFEFAGSASQLQAMINGTNLGVHVQHRDVTAWVGGTVHTDPGTDYPKAELMALASSIANGNNPSTPSPEPTPEDPLLSASDDILAAIKAVDDKSTLTNKTLGLLAGQQNRIATSLGITQGALNGVVNAITALKAALLAQIKAGK